MNLQVLNTICFTLELVCIILGSALAISMIWTEYDNEVLWKSWVTIGVVFLASTLAFMGESGYSNGWPH